MSGSAERPWWKGATIYQIYPRSFADTNGDGIGDLPGITAHLDHVAGLGADAIWLSPFFTSPMADFGYDVADYRDVDPIFGTLADFDALVARAHALGLKVIVDQVYAHTSDRHAWFVESREDRGNPKADWYVWADPRPDGSPPNNWASVFGGAAWTWNARRRQYYMHNFLAAQPQLNVHNAEVQEALLETARFWLDRGVDGFRLDAINFAMHDERLTDNPVAPEEWPKTRPFDYQLHVNNQSQPEVTGFLERIRATMDGYGDRFTVAEVGGYESDREMKLFTQGDTRLNTAYGFDFLYAHRLTPKLVEEALGRWPDTPGTGWPSWAFENHDAPRAISRWADAADAHAIERAKMLLLVCLRGNIFLYYGEELGLTQVEVPFEQLRDPEAIANWPLTLSRDGARTPMPWTHDVPGFGFSDGRPWLPFGPDHGPLSVDLQEADNTSILHVTRACLKLRKAHEALLVGDMTVLHAHEALLVFERVSTSERMLCVFNLAAGSRRWEPDEPARWTVVERVGAGEGWALEGIGGFVAERRA